MLRRAERSGRLGRPVGGIALDGHPLGALDGAQPGSYAGFAGGDGLAVATAVGAFGEVLAVAFYFADTGAPVPGDGAAAGARPMPFGDQIQEPGGLGRLPRVRCGAGPSFGARQPGATGHSSSTQARNPDRVEAGARARRSSHRSRPPRMASGVAEVVVAGEGPGADDADEGVAGQGVGDGGQGPDGQVPPAGFGRDRVHEHAGGDGGQVQRAGADRAAGPCRARVMPRQAKTRAAAAGIAASRAAMAGRWRAASAIRYWAVKLTAVAKYPATSMHPSGQTCRPVTVSAAAAKAGSPVAACPRRHASTSLTWCGSRLRTAATASSLPGGLAG